LHHKNASDLLIPVERITAIRNQLFMTFHEDKGLLVPRYIPENSRKEPKRNSALMGIMLITFAIADIAIVKLVPSGVEAPFIVLGLGCGILGFRNLMMCR
jgi:hypothetical protein